MAKITIQAVENQSQISGEYVAVELQNRPGIFFERIANLQGFFPNDGVIHAWNIPPENAKFWAHYEVSAEGDVLTLDEKTAPKEELGRRIFGEVGNVHANADILRELALIHLRHSADTNHIVASDQNTYLKAERLYQRADIVHTIHRCLPNTIAATWLAEKDGAKSRFPDSPNREHYLDFFHEVARLYHLAVFHTDQQNTLSWDEFAAQEYAGGQQFTAPSDLQDFYKAVQDACHQAEYSLQVKAGKYVNGEFVADLDENGEFVMREMRPADIIRNTVFAVLPATAMADGDPKYPSVAPSLSVELPIETSTPTLCMAEAAGDNLQGNISYQWQERVDGEWTDIAGATASVFDYAGHSGELRVVVRAADYIGGEIFATADVIKIA